MLKSRSARRIAFTLSGGFALMYVNSEFSYNETVTIPGVGSVEHQRLRFRQWVACRRICRGQFLRGAVRFMGVCCRRAI